MMNIKSKIVTECAYREKVPQYARVLTTLGFLELFYLVDLFVNKLKTKFNNLFYRMILNTKRIQNSFTRNFRARDKQMPSKVLFVSKRKRRPRPFGHCAPKL